MIEALQNFSVKEPKHSLNIYPEKQIEHIHFLTLQILFEKNVTQHFCTHPKINFNTYHLLEHFDNFDDFDCLLLFTVQRTNGV